MGAGRGAVHNLQALEHGVDLDPGGLEHLPGLLDDNRRERIAHLFEPGGDEIARDHVLRILQDSARADSDGVSVVARGVQDLRERSIDHQPFIDIVEEGVKQALTRLLVPLSEVLLLASYKGQEACLERVGPSVARVELAGPPEADQRGLRVVGRIALGVSRGSLERLSRSVGASLGITSSQYLYVYAAPR